MTPAIIVPNYNKAKYLGDTLHYLLSQTSGSPVYLRDDASTDESVKVAEAKAKEMGKEINISKNSKNKGVGYTLNQLVKQVAKDGYDHFYICASDDNPEPWIVQELSEMAEDGYDFYACHARRFGIDTQDFITVSGANIASFREGMPILPVGVYSVKVWQELGGRNENLDPVGDFEFFLRFIKNGYRYKVLDKFGYHWRSYEDQMSRKIVDHIKLRKEAFELNGLNW